MCGYGRPERQSRGYGHTGGQHGGRVDQEIDDDDEQVVPADGFELRWYGLHAELLDMPGLMVLRLELSLLGSFGDGAFGHALPLRGVSSCAGVGVKGARVP